MGYGAGGEGGRELVLMWIIYCRGVGEWEWEWVGVDKGTRGWVGWGRMGGVGRKGRWVGG